MSTSTPGKSNSISTGTIVGAAVGGACVFLAILFVVFFYLCRRRKKINTRDLSSPSEPEMDCTYNYLKHCLGLLGTHDRLF